MFDELTQNDVIHSIKTLVKEGNTDNSKYAVWWRHNLLSPARVITRHYELQGTPILRRSINTDIAQTRLLQLGFPIVDTSVVDNFFTKKELESFKILIARKDYDSTNLVDVNIRFFLRDIIWEKTKIWAEKLEELGWKIVSKRKGWNARHQKKGFQTYKQYAWCSLKPIQGQNNLLLFTVGVGSNGDLEYKMDIQWNDKSFNDSKRDLFSSLRKKADAGFKYVEKTEIVKYTWETLIKQSDTFFTNHRDSYTNIFYKLWPEKRLMRLVYNDNNWHQPIERYWNKKWQGRNDKAHHEQYGFGFEEWLFNPRYLIDGIQYGYVRGIDTMPKNTDFINELYLYTLNHKTNEQYLVAKLNDVMVLGKEAVIPDDILNVFETSKVLMLSELKEVNADTKFFKKTSFRPNISFAMNKVLTYEDSVLLPENFLKIHRFIPNKVEGDLEKIVYGIDDSFNHPKFNFNEGNGTGANTYNQNVIGGKRQVRRTHADITNDLHEYLSILYYHKDFKISTEKTKVGNNLVDCVVLKKDSLELFEVKTTNSFLTNVRMALGQIMEYALLDNSILVKRLVIIGPAEPNKRDLMYLKTLKNIIGLPLEYWSYSFEEKIVAKKFKKY